jgi:hypothetical protein
LWTSRVRARGGCVATAGVCAVDRTLERCQVPSWGVPWGWKAPRAKGERLGLGMYPHLEVASVQDTVARIKQAGHRIVQEPKACDWGTEAFVADPDGYTWAVVRLSR